MSVLAGVWLTRLIMYLESSKGVGGNVERGDLDILEEVIKVLRVQQHLGQGLEAGAFPQHGATVQGNILLLISMKKKE